MEGYNRNEQYGNLKGAVGRAKKHRAVPMSGGAKAMLAGLGIMAAAGIAGGAYSLLNSDAEQAPEVDYVAGQFVAKFENEISVRTEEDGNVVTGLEEIDALNDSLKGEVYEQYVSHSDEHELDNIYVITVSKDVDLDKVMEEFAASPNVEYVEREFQLTPDFEVAELTEEELQAFEEQVAGTEPNDHYYPLDAEWDSPFGDHKALWGLYNTDALGAWETTTGLPEIIAAVIDTGVDYNHVDLADRILRDENGKVIGYDFANNDDDPYDDHGHGTHVAGTIAATTNNGIGISGVTWNGKIMPLKVCDRNGGCNWTDVGKALVFAADNGAHVANISLGGKMATPKALAEAIEYADSQGLIILTSAGNYNGDTKNWTPANHPYVLSIAATTPDDEKASFSNWGDIVDVGAPGEQILSLLAKDNNIRGAPIVGKIYTVLRGTSMACPHAVGNVMLILSANPDLIGDREAVQTVMRAGVYEYAKNPDKPAGTGIISYARAVEEAKKH